ncbi:hypothetical protein A2U01_0091613, partial [Trifolium medium]|nr:hypothetical protein [Trifolium medium]
AAGDRHFSEWSGVKISAGGDAARKKVKDIDLQLSELHAAFTVNLS